MLGLRPWEFGKYTLREYGLLVEGYEERERRERANLAQLAIWILGPWLNKGTRLTPNDLLGTERAEDI